MKKYKHISRGFTLIEMMLVVVILSIIIAATVPNFSKGYERFQLRQITDDIKHKARWAQAMAMGKQCTYVLVFNADRTVYNIQRIGIDDKHKERMEPISGRLGRTHKIPSNIQLAIKEDSVHFFSDGTLDPVRIELSAGDIKTVLSSQAMPGALVSFDE